MKRLVLVGGGHSHALVLNHWRQNPLPQVQLTLVSNVKQTPYSGMLPGHVAGSYSFQESHIDLPALAQAVGAELIEDTAITLTPEKRELHCQIQKTVSYDVLSLDIGSTPYLAKIQGAEYGIPAKPVPQFLTAWQSLLERLQETKPSSLTLAIVGGGAGGVELAFNLQTRLQYLLPETGVNLHLWQRGASILPRHPVSARQKINQLCQERGIVIHCQQTVSHIVPVQEKLDLSQYELVTEQGKKLQAHAVFLLTQATPAEWLTTSGLALDNRGFIVVEPTLQSRSHPGIFAAGDIATVVDYPRPKAGIFAVRQGKPLFKNLQRLLQGQTPQPFIPQERYLSVLGTGDGRAMALRGSWHSYGRPWWWLKDKIDRRFMAQFPDGMVSD